MESVDNYNNNDKQPEPLRMVFKGFSVWLELNQIQNDVDDLIKYAASKSGTIPIPEPHVTVVYGVSHLTENEVRRRFLNEIQGAITSWPPLTDNGILVDHSYIGVNAQEMDMAWIELSHCTSHEHEALVKKVHSIMFSDKEGNMIKECPSRWKPHTSLAYDNPENVSAMKHLATSLISQVPSLLANNEREVAAITLWSTAGTIDQWKCLERINMKKQ